MRYGPAATLRVRSIRVIICHERTKSNFEAYKEVWYVQDTTLSCQYKTLCEGVNEGYYVRFI